MMISYPNFADNTVIVIGDIILDRYFWGDVNRISPEAPVPVVKIDRKTENLGGAGNVAANLQGLGCRCVLLGIRGDDDNGRTLIELLQQGTIENTIIPVPGHPTTTKTRIFGQNQQVVRLDEEEITAVKEKTTHHLIDILEASLPQADAVIISDYGKGLLSAELTRGVILRCNSNTVPVFVDPKGNTWEKYRGATCITPNTDEFNLVAPVHAPQDAALTIAGRANNILNQFALEYLLLTRGHQGMSLFKRNAPPFHIATKAKEVFDVSGAGDTVIASLAAAYGTGMAMEQAAEFANTAAGVVIGKVGTRPIEHMELQQIIWDSAIEDVKKIVTRDQAFEKIAAWRKNKKRIVFTNGCFDILHIGHIKLLHRAAEQGDKLIVGMNSDKSVKKLKGAGRPIVPEEERAALLSSIKGVDLVVLFDEETPLGLIRRFQPDILVKGGDYTVETVVGHDIVTKKGGNVVIVPLIDGVSTTNVIESINRIDDKRHL